jgi:hypothetical protein
MMTTGTVAAACQDGMAGKGQKEQVRSFLQAELSKQAKQQCVTALLLLFFILYPIGLNAIFSQARHGVSLQILYRYFQFGFTRPSV